MTWLIFWLVIYLILILYLTTRHVKSGDLENYLVNNRSTKTFPLVATTLATFVGGGTSIGLMAMGYESGFAAVGIGIAYVIGFFILSRFAPRMNRIGRKEKIYSFPQFLNSRFTQDEEHGFSKLFSSAVSGVNIFIFFFLLAAQFVGMASLLKFAFVIDYIPAAIISCLIVIAYTAFAGLAGVILTDLLQFIVIVLMIIFIFIPGIYTDTNGLSRISELPASFINGTYYGWAFIVALPLFLAPSVLIRMDIWQRILAAKNEKVAKKVSIISGLGMLPFYIIFPLVGMTIKITMDTDIEPKDVAYLFLERHSTPFILGFAVVGLMSALMSSGDSFLNLIAISAIRDFAGWRKQKMLADKKHIHKEIRIAAIIIGVIALGMALLLPKIVDLMVVGIATIVIFVPITFLGLVKKDVYPYRKIAVASVMAGFVVNLFFFIWGTIHPEKFQAKSSFIPAFIVALFVLLLGIILHKRKNG
ncbi:MAG: sodium:solute symporter family protein [Bacteroidales bacterium]|nr:sodium:solute symporter family protein [Bacteroidales bacterium]MCF8402581.1 sodium:solute symporter family protein [Bacteroidales bacterium]